MRHIDLDGEVRRRVDALAVSPDGKTLATGSNDNTVRLWNVSSGQLLNSLERPGSPPTVTSVAFAPDGATLAGGRDNHTVQLWQVRTGKVVHDLQALAPVHAIGGATGGTAVAAANLDGTVRFWQPVSGFLRATLILQDQQVAAVSADGHFRVAPGAEPELVYVVQLQRGQETLSPKEFAARYSWKNAPAQVKLAER